MADLTPDYSKRSYLLPPGCKDLYDALQYLKGKKFLVNGQIRAAKVRVIGIDGEQLGIMSRARAFKIAQSLGVDLVEIAAAARPPVCRIVDFGKFCHEQTKRRK